MPINGIDKELNRVGLPSAKELIGKKFCFTAVDISEFGLFTIISTVSSIIMGDSDNIQLYFPRCFDHVTEVVFLELIGLSVGKESWRAIRFNHEECFDNDKNRPPIRFKAQKGELEILD